MMQTMTRTTPINYAYAESGEVRCENTKGLIFFLHAEPPAPKATWTPVPATREVEVRREAVPQPIAEQARPLPESGAWSPVPATHEVEVRREAAPRGTGPLPAVPAPGEEAPKGWFDKLFKK